MKAVFRKKKAVGNMLSCMLGMLFLFIVMYLGLDIYARLNLAIKKIGIERKYMLYMETQGYLAPERKEALASELTAIGVENISFSGSTLAPISYGQEVVLSVTGTIRTNAVVGITRQFSFIREGGSNFKIYRKSTAKNKSG
jgi:hypothetical protein